LWEESWKRRVNVVDGNASFSLCQSVGMELRYLPTCMTSHRDRRAIEVRVRGDFPNSRYMLDLRSASKGEIWGKGFQTGENVGQGRNMWRKIGRRVTCDSGCGWGPLDASPLWARDGERERRSRD
jgi:hypothetical protein